MQREQEVAAGGGMVMGGGAKHRGRAPCRDGEM